MKRMLATLATAALVGSGNLAAAHAAPTDAGDVRATASAGWTVVQPGREQPRSAIPWKSVGRGWSAQTLPVGRESHLVLVAPTGARYLVAKVGRNDYIVDIRADGRVVSIVDLVAHRSRVVDLRTGRTLVSVPMARIEFDGPAGRGLLTYSLKASGRGVTIDGLQRRDYRGRVLAVTKIPFDRVYPSLDGRFLLGRYKDAVTRLDPRTLRLGSAYAKPAGYRGCAPGQAWDTTSFVAYCWRSDDDGAMFVQKYAGGAPVQKTFGRVPGSLGPAAGIAHSSLGLVAFVPTEWGSEWGGYVPYLVQGKTMKRIPLPQQYMTSYSSTEVVGSTFFVGRARGGYDPVDHAAVDVKAHRIVRFGNVVSVAVVGAE